MSQIKIVDLEVFYHVGITDEERAKPQRLLISIDMEYDFSVAAASDRLGKTIDYSTVARQAIAFGENRSWKLIEKVAANLADFVITEHGPQAVTVEVKKFVIPAARYVSVVWTSQ